MLSAFQAYRRRFFLDMRLLKKVCFSHFLSIFVNILSIFVNIDQYTVLRMGRCCTVGSIGSSIGSMLHSWITVGFIGSSVG